MAGHVVLCREVVLFSEVQNVLVLWEWYFEECPLWEVVLVYRRFHCVSHWLDSLETRLPPLQF